MHVNELAFHCDGPVKNFDTNAIELGSASIGHRNFKGPSLPFARTKTGLRRPEVPGFGARAVASSGVGRSLDRSPGALAVESSGLSLIPRVSRRSVARRDPGRGLALQAGAWCL